MEMIWAGAKMILALGAVLAVLFLFLRLSKRLAVARGNLPAAGQVRILSTKAIAPRKYISLVGIADQVLVLGISEAQITLLDKMGAPELAEKIETPEAVRPAPSSILDYFSLGRKRLGRGPMRILREK